MIDTTELDTKQDAVSPNGHDSTWLSFDDNAAMLKHILSKELGEEIVDVPEWGVRILCKTLDAQGRIAVEAKAYDKDTKTTDYRRALDLVVVYGCHNPKTDLRCFKEEHAPFLMKNGGPTSRLALTVLRLSQMLAADAANAKKN